MKIYLFFITVVVHWSIVKLTIFYHFKCQCVIKFFCSKDYLQPDNIAGKHMILNGNFKK